MSLRLLHPEAQHPSPSVQVVISIVVQNASQVVAEPLKESSVHALESSQAVGQFPSQISFVSMTPLPQSGLQSVSLLLLQPLAQHPSPLVQAVIPVNTQTASQLEELPFRESDVQLSPSLQVAGQFPSQVSPTSTILLEQMESQSLSSRLVHPGGQQPSPESHRVMSV